MEVPLWHGGAALKSCTDGRGDWGTSRTVVQNSGDHFTGALAPFRRSGTSSRSCPRCSSRGTAQPALRGRLAVPGLRRAAGAHHQRRAADPAAPARRPQRPLFPSGPSRVPIGDGRGIGEDAPDLSTWPGPSARDVRPRRSAAAASRTPRDQAAHTFRVHTGHTDVPAVRLAGGGRADRPCWTPRSPPAVPSSTCCGSTATPPSSRVRRRERPAWRSWTPSARPGCGASG